MNKSDYRKQMLNKKELARQTKELKEAMRPFDWRNTSPKTFGIVYSGSNLRRANSRKRKAGKLNKRGW